MFLLMTRRPPRSTLTDTLCTYTPLFRSPDTPCRARSQHEWWPQHSCPAPHNSSRWHPVDHNPAGCPDRFDPVPAPPTAVRSEEHTSELQSLMRISYAVFCLTKTSLHHK